MIDYKANYEPLKKPYICKVFTASNGEEVHTAMNISNEEEVASFSVELIYEHIENVLQYMRDKSETLTVIQYEEEVNGEPWPVKGWKDMEWAINEIGLWWSYIYFKERPVSNSIVVEEHIHDGTEDHTHDAETGEPIPNA